MKILRELLFLLFLFTSMAPVLWAEDEPSLRQFVVRQGDRLFVGEEEFRFISFNIPNLHLIEDHFAFPKSNPWRWPDAFEISDALESVRQMGGTVVRIYVLGVRREGSDMGDHVFVRGPGEFNEEAFLALDQVLAIAAKKGIRIIIPFVDNWHWWGGKKEYAQFRGKEPDDFWTDAQIIEDFKATIAYTLTRRNTVTGKVYKDDPAIFGWETGNELDCPPEWTSQIAAYIKSIDSNHLLIDGYALHGVRQESLDDPNIDVITTHHYPNTKDHYVSAIKEARRMTAGKKPYFVGEFGFIPTEEIEEVLDTVIDEGVAGALLWSLRSHNRDGGFYWHWEGASDGSYKAYHWPGFESGEPYDERQVLSLLRNKAYAIRGLAVPKREPPIAPKLFPIADSGSISWQGAAGAGSYCVERSTAPQGPWEIVGSEVSDAQVQYRPLFNDESVVVGQSYFYRITAKNSAGQSLPSNVVGPVNIREKVFVDECSGFKKLAGHQGQVTFITGNERTTQEDIHRLQMLPESSITYRVDQSISSWKVFLFLKEKNADLQVTISTDGQRFLPCKFQQEMATSKTSDYGYYLPLLLKGEIDSEDVSHLRIMFPRSENREAENLEVQVSRVEIRYGAQNENLSKNKNQKALRSVALNPAVLLFHKPHQTEGVSAVRRAAELGSTAVNVVVTLQCKIDEARQVVEYGVLEQGKFKPLNEDRLKKFQATIRRTCAEAVKHGLDISVLAHLNSWGEIGDWRNNFQFDPLTKYGNYSYEEALIVPITKALATTVKPTTKVDFTIAGEMGKSVFAHADAYQKVIEHAKNNGAPPQTAYGLSFNFNRVDGNSESSSVQIGQVQNLIDDSDFVGLSNYRWFDLPPDTEDFAITIRHFLQEMESRGIEVAAEKPLHFSEVGIGGGTENNRLALSPAIAVQTPWHGSDQLLRNPWQSPEMRKLRLDYHRALLGFLKRQPKDNPVTQAYLWSEGSWDPMGISEDGFADQQIIKLIQEHNESTLGHPSGD